MEGEVGLASRARPALSPMIRFTTRESARGRQKLFWRVEHTAIYIVDSSRSRSARETYLVQ